MVKGCVDDVWRNVYIRTHVHASTSGGVLQIESRDSGCILYFMALWRNDECFYLRDIPVEFPFKPYPSQMVYMEKVIEALQEARVMCT